MSKPVGVKTLTDDENKNLDQLTDPSEIAITELLIDRTNLGGGAAVILAKKVCEKISEVVRASLLEEVRAACVKEYRAKEDRWKKRTDTLIKEIDTMKKKVEEDEKDFAELDKGKVFVSKLELNNLLWLIVQVEDISKCLETLSALHDSVPQHSVDREDLDFSISNLSNIIRRLCADNRGYLRNILKISGDV